jgi:hypothetical protein
MFRPHITHRIFCVFVVVLYGLLPYFDIYRDYICAVAVAAAAAAKLKCSNNNDYQV